MTLKTFNEGLFIKVFFRHAGLEEPAPYLIRGFPEALEKTGFRLEFIPMKIGAGMTILTEGAV